MPPKTATYFNCSDTDDAGGVALKSENAIHHTKPEIFVGD
jgi:hypothetical protein